MLPGKFWCLSPAFIGYRGQALDFDSRCFMHNWTIFGIKIECQSPVKIRIALKIEQELELLQKPQLAFV